MGNGQSISSVLTQILPPKPLFTVKDVPTLEGKVYIVTGSNTGVGKALAQILYSKNAKVYVAARSKEKAERAIEDIVSAHPKSTGQLVFLKIDLSDLTTIKASVNEFLSKETLLHVLFNNAGVMMPPKGSRSAQGFEIHLGVNNLGTFLFTKLLTPILASTVKSELPNAVRVVWVSSSGTEIFGLKNVGVDMDNLDFHNDLRDIEKYSVSKIGNYLHAVEYAKRYKAEGIVSCALNPGNLKSDLARDSAWGYKILVALFGYPPVMGAHTELFAGLSPDVTLEKSGSWIIPFGRFQPIRPDLTNATKTEAEGGNGTGLKFWDWTEAQLKLHV
ncbi:hypothetical protein BJ875DRAFT_471927 [Amylocarpus encephaloides]|uniref:Short-chain dehydrogenase n=1 Tax=Amylocarpus encephaloides TaxID=45428 RepID=A0A9P8C218_9HELO|nr:hypothetical protein BJ875DRAFT_471927 [Amylocarpus encephaloides]